MWSGSCTNCVTEKAERIYGEWIICRGHYAKWLYAFQQCGAFWREYGHPEFGDGSQAHQHPSQPALCRRWQPTAGIGADPAAQSLCIVGCKHCTKGGGDLIRCSLCGKWYHVKCLKLSTDEIGGVWPCFDCRNLSSDLKRTQSYIITLMDQVQHLVDSHDNEIAALKAWASRKM